MRRTNHGKAQQKELEVAAGAARSVQAGQASQAGDPARNPQDTFLLLIKKRRRMIMEMLQNLPGLVVIRRSMSGVKNTSAWAVLVNSARINSIWMISHIDPPTLQPLHSPGLNVADRRFSAPKTQRARS